MVWHSCMETPVGGQNAVASPEMVSQWPLTVEVGGRGSTKEVGRGGSAGLM